MAYSETPPPLTSEHSTQVVPPPPQPSYSCHPCNLCSWLDLEEAFALFEVIPRFLTFSTLSSAVCACFSGRLAVYSAISYSLLSCLHPLSYGTKLFYWRIPWAMSYRPLGDDLACHPHLIPRHLHPQPFYQAISLNSVPKVTNILTSRARVMCWLSIILLLLFSASLTACYEIRKIKRFTIAVSIFQVGADTLYRFWNWFFTISSTASIEMKRDLTLSDWAFFLVISFFLLAFFFIMLKQFLNAIAFMAKSGMPIWLDEIL